MTVFKRGTVSSIRYYMEMTYHANSSIELMIASDGTNNEIYNELIFIYGMSEFYDTTYI